jgi:hypothetical protein
MRNQVVEPATNLLETSHGRRERVVEFFDGKRRIGFEYAVAMNGWRARRRLDCKPVFWMTRSSRLSLSPANKWA